MQRVLGHRILAQTRHCRYQRLGRRGGGAAGFFKALPSPLDAAVLVLHIPADTPSQLDRIPSYSTQLPVTFARDGEAIESGQVYVASTDRHLMATPQGIRLSQGPGKADPGRPSTCCSDWPPRHSARALSA